MRPTWIYTCEVTFDTPGGQATGIQVIEHRAQTTAAADDYESKNMGCWRTDRRVCDDDVLLAWVNASSCAAVKALAARSFKVVNFVPRSSGCGICGYPVILADTDEWKVSVCYECFHALGEPTKEPEVIPWYDKDGNLVRYVHRWYDKHLKMWIAGPFTIPDESCPECGSTELRTDTSGAVDCVSCGATVRGLRRA